MPTKIKNCEKKHLISFVSFYLTMLVETARPVYNRCEKNSLASSFQVSLRFQKKVIKVHQIRLMR